MSADLSVNFEDTAAALVRIRSVLAVTPLTYSPRISELTGKDVYLKWESFHRTGSFKERGAVNFLLSPHPHKLTHVCAASAGNHGLGLAYHSRRLGIKCSIVMPLNAPLVKVQQAEKYGAEVILHGASFDDARTYATSLAESSGASFVPAYDHPLVIAGQASTGHEILAQLPDTDCIISPVGGGGLISGISIVAKERHPQVFIIGVQSDWVTKKSYSRAEKSVLVPGSLADGIAVKSFGKHTMPIVEQKVDLLTSVDENQIASCMVQLLEDEHAVVEGGGAVGLAPLLEKRIPGWCKKVVVVISGANVDLGVLSRVVNRELVMRSKQVRLLLSVPDRAGVLHTLSSVFAEQRANVLEVQHERAFSYLPGNVDVTFVIEVRDTDHRSRVVHALKDIGVEILSVGAVDMRPGS